MMESLELAQLREILVVVLLGLLSLVIAVLLDAGLLMRESFRKEQEQDRRPAETFSPHAISCTV